MKKKKVLIIPGLLALITLILYIIFRYGQSKISYGTMAFVDVITMSASFLLYCGSILMFLLYCVLFSNTKIEKVFRYITFLFLGCVNLYFCILDMSGFPYSLRWVIQELIVFLFCVLVLVFEKFRWKGLITTGIILLVINLVMGIPYIFKSFEYIKDTDYFLMIFCQSVYNVLEALAFITFLGVLRKTCLTQKQNVSNKVSLETELLNLKKQHENGVLTEQEYKEKKAKIINKL